VNFIVDANIVFSAILNTNGKIGDILINSKGYFNFIAPDFLRAEIRKHHPRLAAISGMTLKQVRESERQVTEQIRFILLSKIRPVHWKSAHQLVINVDPKDTPYIACTKQFKCKLWSGDKKLMKGLTRKNFGDCISTDELFKLREIMKARQ
jgi:predicted nucleic acid-binding protein